MSNQLSTSTDPIPAAWIDALFAKMLSLYGNKFSEMWRDLDLIAVKAVWAQELQKLSRNEVAKGANSLVTQEWPPTLPQFIKLCRISIDPLKAYYEAVNGAAARERGEIGEWSHPAIFWSFVAIGAFDIKHQTYSAIRERWESALAEELNKGAWKDIPNAVIAIAASSEKAQKEIADKYISETKVIKNENDNIDHKRWARKIMDRERKGDKSLSHIQVLFAKEALGII